MGTASLAPSSWLCSKPAAKLCSPESLPTNWGTCVVLRKIRTRDNIPPFGKPKKIKPHSPTFLPQYYLGTFFWKFFDIHLAHCCDCSLYTIWFPIPSTTTSAGLPRVTCSMQPFPAIPRPRETDLFCPLCIHYSLNTLESCSSETLLINLNIRLPL